MLCKAFIVMAVCHDLPVLPLDRHIPKNVLRRRGAISFSSTSSLFKSLPRLERRGGISYSRDDKAAKYVRMLGDIKNSINDMQHIELGSKVPLKRRCSLPERDVKLLQDLSNHDKTKKPLTRIHSSSLCRMHRHSRKSEKNSRQQVAENESIHVDEQYPGQVKESVANLGNWDFDIFHLELVTGGHPLEPVVMELFQKYDLIRTFRLDYVQLRRCIGLIHRGYHNKNPYHNATHAADVTQAMHCYINDPSLFENLKPIEIMSALLAATTHDLDHPAVNQVFLITCKHHLASLYKNNSVLENHHWRSAVSLIRESGVFSHLKKSEWDCIVKLIRELILATDIARQMEFIEKFRKHLDQQSLQLRTDANHRLFILQIALKCADICNPCRKWHVSSRWSRMIVKEFFGQGDQERRLGLPVSELNDRTKNTCAKIQEGFIGFVVEPLFKLWHRFQPNQLSEYMLENAQSNQKRWVEIKQGEAETKNRTSKESQSAKIEAIVTNLKERTHRVENKTKQKEKEKICNGHVVKLNSNTTEQQQIKAKQHKLTTQLSKDSMTQTSMCNSDSKATQTNHSVLKPILPTKQHSADDVQTTVIGYHRTAGQLHTESPTSSVQLATCLRTNSEEVINSDVGLNASKLYPPLERKRSNTNVSLHRDSSILLPLRLLKKTSVHTVNKTFENPWRLRDMDQEPYQYQGLNNNIVGKYSPSAKPNKPSVSFNLSPQSLSHMSSRSSTFSSPPIDYLRSSPSNLGSPAIKKRMHQFNIRRGLDMRFQGDLSPRPRRRGEFGYLGAFEPLVQQFASDQRRKVEEFQQQRKESASLLPNKSSTSGREEDPLPMARNGRVANFNQISSSVKSVDLDPSL